MSFFEKAKTNVYAKKAALTYDECMWLYESGSVSGKADSEGERKKVEKSVQDKLHQLFPERRERNLNWQKAEEALKDHLSLEDRTKVLSKMFNE